VLYKSIAIETTKIDDSRTKRVIYRRLEQLLEAT
jgi:hypothetical protein